MKRSEGRESGPLPYSSTRRMIAHAATPLRSSRAPSSFAHADQPGGRSTGARAGLAAAPGARLRGRPARVRRRARPNGGNATPPVALDGSVRRAGSPPPSRTRSRNRQFARRAHNLTLDVGAALLDQIATVDPPAPASPASTA